ncbi:MAG TPA: pantetheine-phosphate adenylyltransferase [Candidatus Marinimicrobia bacterium]|jgi:pantetheine-phosphate adenylyltransferase|nr:pantetheine-phosphate adenylyltransferase [Candidatus Neomarinimicrobiota bacterium]
MKKIIYPGTFDPITNGHLDIAERASKLFDELIFVVANNPDKQQLFSVAERMEMISKSTGYLSNIKVETTKILTVDFAKENSALAIIRGLRHVSDFEYEFQMAMMNYNMAPEITTIFMMPSEKYVHLNSSILKDIAKLKGNVSEYVPVYVLEQLQSKLNS